MTLDSIQEIHSKHIVIAATHPLQCTGYARVGATLANGFVARGHRVTYWGYQNLAPTSNRTINPSVNVIDVGAMVGDGWSFGEHAFPQTVSAIKPDTLLLYNDVMVLNRFLDAVDAQYPTSIDGTRHPSKPTIACYVDLVHDDQDPRLVDGIVRRADSVWVFAPHWRDHLVAMYPDRTGDIHVVPHGMDETMLEVGDALTKLDARKSLGIPDDVFMVVNTNRNSYRKALDLTVDAFLRFWNTHRDAVLVLNNNEHTDSGYDITSTIISTCRRLGIDDLETVLNTAILRIQNGGFMPDDAVAKLHIASDVGVNTCLGEGFGLCQLEGACLGRPQIATNTGGLVDILNNDDVHHLIEPSVHLTLPRGFVAHSGTLDIPDPKDVAKALDAVYDSRPDVDTTNIRQTYDWTAILDRAAHLV